MIVLFSQTIECRIETNRDLITRVSRAKDHLFTLSSDWLLMILYFPLIGRCEGIEVTLRLRNQKYYSLFNKLMTRKSCIKQMPDYSRACGRATVSELIRKEVLTHLKTYIPLIVV